jgi:hypothetical protein
MKNPRVEQIFNDLDKYRDFCRYEGKVFNESALYNKRDGNWQLYEKYLANASKRQVRTR